MVSTRGIAGWFKRFLLRLEFAFRDTRRESKLPPLPDHLRMEIARCILPDIVAYFESERGQREFAEWKKKKLAESRKDEEQSANFAPYVYKVHFCKYIAYTIFDKVTMIN